MMIQEPFKDLEKRMGVEEFKDLLLCCGNIYLWKLDSGGNLLQSNCPDEAVLGTAFELLGCKQRIVDYGSSHSREPFPAWFGMPLLSVRTER